MAGEKLKNTLMKYRERYAAAEGKKAKGQVLDEFCRLSNYHRKYAIDLLRPSRQVREGEIRRRRGVSYSREALRAIEDIWRAAGYPWSVRLKALIPLWLPWAKKRLEGLTPQVERQMLSISPRQLDRRLRSKKRKLRRRIYGRGKPGTLLRHLVPLRAEAAKVEQPGFTEMDLVESCGGSARGEFAYTLNLTDLASGWCESQGFLGRSQEATVDALEEIRRRLPFALRGINSDNGSEFLNYHLVRYSKRLGLQFTRTRPYKKDDNAHIEQKNWTHVRRLIGWGRYQTPQAVAAMNDLYQSVRLMMNLFQPSVRLRERQRVGSRLRRRYDQAKTPLDRLVEAYGSQLPAAVVQYMELRKNLDPFVLAQAIADKQQKLFSLEAGARVFAWESRVEYRPGAALSPMGDRAPKEEATHVR